MYHNHNRGFAALIAVLVISAILVALTFATSTGSFFARADLLDAEYTAQATDLARGCIEAALLKLALDASYRPSADGESISVDEHHACVIISITSSGSSLRITAAGESGRVRVLLTATVRPRPSQEALDSGVPDFKILSIRKITGQ